MKKNATNSANMKTGNRRLLLDIIRKEPVSRAELARLTGLTRAAVTLIVDDLIKDNILIEIGTAESDFGRKPVLLDLNSQNNFVIGINLAREGCSVCILNIKAEPLLKRKVDFDASWSVERCLKILIENVEKLVFDSKVPFEKVLGIGIVSPGPVDIYEGKILNPPNFVKWHNVNIIQEFKKHFKIDVCLENYSTSLTIAEKNYGSGLKFNSFLLIVVDEGIGAGIVINDNLYRGVGGFGNELGHTTINIGGKQCDCGNKGCLEVYASIPSVLRELSESGVIVSGWNELVDYALAGDELYIKAIQKEAQFLSAGIVNAMNLLELEAVILTGDINYMPDLLMDLIRKNVEASSITRNIRKIKIINSSITDNIEVKASAAVIIERFFSK